MRRNFRRMAIFCLVMAMGILPMSAHSNIASAQEQEQTGTLVMTKEDEIDSFDDLAGMTLDMSNKNIVPDENGKVEIDVNDAVPQGNMARNMIQGELKFWISDLNDFSGMTGVATYVNTMPAALDMIEDAHKKGYETTCNIMAISNAKESDINTALEMLGNSPVDGIYIVDSFGSLFPEQIRKISE